MSKDSKLKMLINPNFFIEIGRGHTEYEWECMFYKELSDLQKYFEIRSREQVFECFDRRMQEQENWADTLVDKATALSIECENDKIDYRSCSMIRFDEEIKRRLNK